MGVGIEWKGRGWKSETDTGTQSLGALSPGMSSLLARLLNAGGKLSIFQLRLLASSPGQQRLSGFRSRKQGKKMEELSV